MQTQQTDTVQMADVSGIMENNEIIMNANDKSPN